MVGATVWQINFYRLLALRLLVFFVVALSLPWLLGYSVMGLLSFPLESEFAAGMAQMIGKLVN